MGSACIPDPDECVGENCHICEMRGMTEFQYADHMFRVHGYRLRTQESETNKAVLRLSEQMAEIQNKIDIIVEKLSLNNTKEGVNND